MLEVAIISIKCALRDEFPEFHEFWEAKSWETKPEKAAEAESAEAESEEKKEESVDAEVGAAPEKEIGNDAE